MTASPMTCAGQWCALPWRCCAWAATAAAQLALLLACSAVRGQQLEVVRPQAAPAAEQAEYDQYIEVSPKGETLLERLAVQLKDGDYQGAALVIADLGDIGPEAVCPTTWRGVWATERELIGGLPAEARKRLDEAMSSEARKALEAARLSAAPEALAEVARKFPGTSEARQALAALWAAAFEAGQFHRAVELIELYLADPLVAGDDRRTALVVCGAAAARAGNVAALERALAQLKALGATGEVAVAGVRVKPAPLLEQLLEGAAAPAGDWPNLGGGPDRTRAAATQMNLGGPLVFGREGSLSLQTFRFERLPTRKELLQRRASDEDVSVERLALVTERILLVSRDGVLLALDRLSGDELWRAPLAAEGVPLNVVSWPSCGEGYVALIMSSRSVVSSRLRVNVLMGAAAVQVEPARQLLVLREATGEPVWSWSGAEGEPQADLWSKPRSAPGPGGPAGLRPGVAGLRPGGAGPAPQGGPPGGGPPAEAAQAVERVPVGSPLIYGGRLFVGAAGVTGQEMPTDCFLLCFELQTGQLLWQRFIGSGQPANYPKSGNSLDRMVPCTDGRRVYVESPVRTVAAVDLATAEVVWVQRYKVPRQRQPYTPLTGDWPSGIADAPMVVGGRLLVSSVFGPAMCCLEAETGKILWADVKLPAGYRLGVGGGMLFAAGGETLDGYDLDSGRKKFTRALPGKVSGRGFVAQDAVYVPTESGVVRVRWSDGEVKTVYDYGEAGAAEGGPSLALAPLGGGFISNHADRVLLFGPIEAFLAEVERGHQEHPDDPQWTRRLAELSRHQGDFAGAESYLKAAVEQAARLTDTQRSRDEQLLAYQRLGRLYQEWAEALSGAGQSPEAAARFELALRYATSPAAKAAALMALARHWERAGDRVQAAAYYARVAADGAAQRLLVSTRTPGLQTTLAGAAEAALALLQVTGEAAPKPAPLGRQDIALLRVERVGRLSWSGPSFVLSDDSQQVSPMVWARSDGLVAFGPRGEIRWRYSRPTAPGEWSAEVLADAGLVCEKRTESVTVHRLRDGTVAWQWKAPQGRQLSGHWVAGLWGGAQFGGQRRLVRRIQIVNNQVVQTFESTDELPDDSYPDFLAAGGKLLWASSPLERPDLTLHGLDLATGQEAWSYRVPAAGRLVGVKASGDKIAATVLLQIGSLLTVCLDGATGRELWRNRGGALQVGQPICLFDKGLFVYADALGGVLVVDAETGTTLWQSTGGRPDQAGTTPLAVTDEALIMANADSYLALDRKTGSRRWAVEAAPGAPGAGEGYPPASAVLVAGRNLIASCGDTVTALRLSDGGLVWRYEIGNPVPGNYRLLVCGDMLVVYGQRETEARLRFLDLASGKFLGQVELGSAAGGQTYGVPNFLRVVAMPGGFCATNGDEILSIMPGRSN